MIQEVLQKALGTLVVNYQGTTLDFSGDWPEQTYRDLVLQYTNIDLHSIESLDHLKEEIKSKNLSIPLEKYKSLGGLMDGLYKKYCRPLLIQPMFLTMHPTELIPLARSCDKNPAELEMFQVVVNSWEIVKAYSELVDPILQRERLMEQQTLAAAGEEETMMLEEDFLEAMEHGMPPISGVGIGIERLVSLLSDSPNIRDVIYFPTVRNKS
jgi:lysyl-tRNA synthetase class 2